MAKPEWMPQRLYQWVKPRSLILHLVYVSCSTGCLIAMWWQIHRAMQGNVLSYLYSVEWPTFVVVGGIGWWQLFHDTPEFIAERRAYHQRMRAASAAVVARTLPRSALALTVDSHDLPANRLGAGAGGAERELPAGDAPWSAALQGPSSLEDATTILPMSHGRPYSPGSPVAGGTLVGGSLAAFDDSGYYDAGLDGADSGTEDEMTQYNRYLALLAVKGKAKTWRNPNGFKAEGSS
ncbi:MAG: hypothetical protein ACP5P1_03560 [Acidimicrobiales bacterium]